MKNNNGFGFNVLNENTIVVSNYSMLTGHFNFQEWDVPPDAFSKGYTEWLAGKLPQYAMPFLTDNQWKFVMSGITPEEWDAEFNRRTFPRSGKTAEATV